MKTAFYCIASTKPASLHCLACKLTRPLICCWRSMAPPYLSVMKSRYSYCVPEVEARRKAVSIIFYWEGGYVKRPAVSSESRRITSWRASWSQTTTASTEIRDTKCRPVQRYSGSVLLSENKVQVSWPQFVRDVFTLTYNNFTLSLPRSISNFSCSQKYHTRWYAHSSLRWKMIILIPILTTSVTYTFLLKGWENVTFDLGNERLI